MATRRRARIPRRPSARRENSAARSLKMSKSLRAPRWGGDGRVEAVDEGVHIGGGQVVLLVPGGGGQDDVGIDARRGHPEVDVDQQVQLALRGPPPPRRPRPAAVPVRTPRPPLRLSAPSRWRRKYSCPFPEEPSRLERHTVSTRGKLAGLSGSLAAKRDRPAVELVDDEVANILAGRVGLVGEVQRVAVEGRMGGQPPLAGRIGVEVCHRAADETGPRRAGWRAGRPGPPRNATGRWPGTSTGWRACAGWAGPSRRRRRG